MPASISFTRGVPAPDLLPVDDMRAAAARALDADSGRRALVRARRLPAAARVDRRAPRRRPRPRADRRTARCRASASSPSTSSPASGGSAVVEAPTYDRTLKILRARRRRHPRRAARRRRHRRRPPRRAARRRAAAAARLRHPDLPEPLRALRVAASGGGRCVALAREHDLLLVEDDPYGLLRFEGEALPTLHELDGGERVIYCSSFTKTIAPGVRTGYLVAAGARWSKPLAVMSENTHIGPNTLAEAVVWAYCDAGRFEPNVARATEGLRARRDAMEAALRDALPGGVAVDDAARRLLLLGRPAGRDRHHRRAPARGRAGRPVRQGSRLLRRRGRPRARCGSHSAPAPPIRSTRASPGLAALLAAPRVPGRRRRELTYSGSPAHFPYSEEERVVAAGRARSRVSLRDRSGWPPPARRP